MTSHNTNNSNSFSINESSSLFNLNNAFLEENSDEKMMNSTDDIFFDSYGSPQTEEEATTEAIMSLDIYNSEESYTSNGDNSTEYMLLPPSMNCFQKLKTKDIDGKFYFFPESIINVETPESQNDKPNYNEPNNVLLKGIYNEIDQRDIIENTLINSNDTVTVSRLNTILENTEKSSIVETDDSSYIMKRCLNTSTDFTLDSSAERSLGLHDISFASSNISQSSFFTALCEESTFLDSISSDIECSTIELQSTTESKDAVELAKANPKYELIVAKTDKNLGKKRRSLSWTLDCTKDNKTITPRKQGRGHHFCTPVDCSPVVLTTPIKSVKLLKEYFSDMGRQEMVSKSPLRRRKKGPSKPFIIIMPATPD